MNKSTVPSESARERPNAPEPALLEKATDALSQRLGFAPTAYWEILERFERPSSTVFRLRNTYGGQAVYVFYKADFVPRELNVDRRNQLIERHRQALLVEDQLAPTLRRAFAGEAIQFDEPLAVDADRLTAVRLEVAGRPLGKAIGYAVPGRWKHGRRVYQTVGRALRIIQEVGSSLPTSPSAPTAVQRMARELEKSREHLTALQRSQVENLLVRYMQERSADNDLVWVHRDVSQSNILDDGDGIGIIDFSWGSDLRYRDLAHLVTRVECESPQAAPCTSAMIAAVFDGFGIERTDQSVAWRVALLRYALRAVRDQRPRPQRWGRQVLRELGIGQ